MKNKIKSECASIHDDGIFDDFKVNLDDLKPEIREKAIAFAHELIEQGIDRLQAVKDGIKKAETWFLEAQG